jgi:hypothetical protein
VISGPAADAARFTAGSLSVLVQIAETGVMGRFLMIAKEFIPEMGEDPSRS